MWGFNYLPRELELLDIFFYLLPADSSPPTSFPLSNLDFNLNSSFEMLAPSKLPYSRDSSVPDFSNGAIDTYLPYLGLTTLLAPTIGPTTAAAKFRSSFLISAVPCPTFEPPLATVLPPTTTQSAICALPSLALF